MKPLITLLVLLWAVALAHQAAASERFKQANQHFSEAKEAALEHPQKARELYRKASLDYLYLIDHEGVSTPELYVNLANSYFFSGDKGRAVLHYQHALRIDSTHSDAIHNLSYVRSLLSDKLPAEASFSFWRFVTLWHVWPYELRLFLFVAFQLLGWGMAGRLFYNRTKVIYATVAGSVLLSILLGVSLLASLNAWDNPVDGVIIENEVVARHGDGLIYANAFKSPLHSGTEFGLIEQRGDWYHVELLDGSQCWLPRQSVALVDG